jgi:CRP/FNR family transcriptional regulator, cyclic AMP receptor protein
MYMLATVKQTEEFINLFRTRGKRLSYAKGEFIIRPGDTPSGVFFIESGLVKAYDITKYGENLLIIRKAGEIFPLIWAITGQERQVIYETVNPTIVWQMPKEVFTELMHEHPGALFLLLSMTVEMYRIHSERIINLEYRTVRERLISFLLTMSQRFGKTTKEGLVINVPLRHQDIASSINSSRETTSREMVALERKGLLVNQQTYITLKDIAELRSYL